MKSRLRTDLWARRWSGLSRWWGRKARKVNKGQKAITEIQGRRVRRAIRVILTTRGHRAVRGRRVTPALPVLGFRLAEHTGRCFQKRPAMITIPSGLILRKLAYTLQME